MAWADAEGLRHLVGLEEASRICSMAFKRWFNIQISDGHGY
jgi:hypothetical protein